MVKIVTPKPKVQVKPKSSNVTEQFDNLQADRSVEESTGIEAWHGTPRKFESGVRILDKETGKTVVRKPNDPMTDLLNKRYPDRYEIVQESELGLFDDAKIGTGEGAQAFGYGHYAAGGIGTGRNYRSSLLGSHGIDDISTISGKPLSAHYSKLMDAEAKGDPTAWEKLSILEDLEFGGDTLAVRETINDADKGFSQSTKDWFFNEVEPNFDRPGALYKLNINTSDDKLIDYKADISEQPKAVQDVISKYREQFDEYVDDYGGVDLEDQMGVDLYDTIAVMLEQDRLPYANGSAIEQALENGQRDKAASLFLKEHGVDGIKYADGVSRRKNEKVYNYVVFDPALITIAKKYGVSLPVAAKIAAGAATTYGVLQSDQAEAAAWSEGLEMILRKYHAGEKLSGPEKSALTRYTKALENRAVNYREGMRRTGETVEVVTPQPPKKIITPEDMQGNVLVPVMGDKSRTGVEVKQIRGVKLSHSVFIEGGPGYAQQHAKRKKAWASNKAAAEGKQSNIDKAAKETGLDPLGVYVGMADSGSHFSVPVSELMLAQIPSLRIPKRDIKEFNDLIKTRFPDFVGIDNKEVFDQIKNQGRFKDAESSGELRKFIIDRMKLASWRDRGFPVYDDVIQLVNEIELQDMDVGTAGRTVFEGIPGAKVEPGAPHETYSDDIAGLYKGSLEIMVPPSIMFPKTFDKLAQKVDYKGDTLSWQNRLDLLQKMHLHEVADQQWLDIQRTFIENRNNPAKLKELVKKGVLPASLLFSSMFASAEDYPEYSNPQAKEYIDQAIAVRDKILSNGNAKGAIGFDEEGAPIYAPLRLPVNKISIPAGIQLDEAQRSDGITIPETSDQLESRYMAQQIALSESADNEFLNQYLSDVSSQDQAEQQPFLPEIDPNAPAFWKGVGTVARNVTDATIQAPIGMWEAAAEMADFLETVAPTGEVAHINLPPSTLGGALVRGFSQFLTGMILPNKVQGFMAMPKVLRPFVSGAFADAFAFDPNDPNAIHMINQIPGLEDYSNDILEALKNDPDDPEWMNRLRNSAVGGITGVAFEVVAKGLSALAKMFKAKAAVKASATATGAGAISTQDAMEESNSLADYANRLADESQEFIPFEDTVANQFVEFETRVKEFGTGSTKAAPEAADNINLAYIETTDDVESLIQKVAEADALDINAARRDQITFDETQKLATDLGMTVEELLSRRRGQAFNAEQILAARKILIASGENLMRLAEKAKNGGDNDLAVFRRAMALHKAIQNQVSGMTAEAGRALNSFKIIAKSQREQERMIKDAINAVGGVETLQAQADAILKARNIEELNKTVQKTFGARAADMVYEVWINGLLSGLPTHMMNILGNSITAGMVPLERKLASVLGGGQAIPKGEATATVQGIVYGFFDGLIAAGRYIKTGESQTVKSKWDMNTEGKRAVSAENTRTSGHLAMGIDLLGSVIRVPTAALQTMDEFFKAVAYRTQLHSLAFRKANLEGLTGDAFDKRMKEIIDNPPEDIRMESSTFAEYQTFTKDLGPAGTYLMRARNESWSARVVVPFLKTPINILKYSLERTPLAPLSSKVREEIAAGGARRDMAMAKIALGSMIMAVSAEMQRSGLITGGGPGNYSQNNVLKATGWKPYAFKVGDKYIQYNRLDPVGQIIGIAADISEILAYYPEAEADELAMASVIAVSQNVLNKSYLSGLADTIETIARMQIDPEGRNLGAKNYFYRLTGSVVPTFVANIEREMNPEYSAVNSMIDSWKARTPGLSDDLPPSRNIFGEVVYFEGGIGPDIASPLYVSSDKKDPVADEIALHHVGITMVSDVMDNIQLDPWQYDRYVQLATGIDFPGVKMNLKEALADMFSRNSYQRLTPGPEGRKADLIKSVVTQYKQNAKLQMYREYPELLVQKKQLEAENRINKLGR